MPRCCSLSLGEMTVDTSFTFSFSGPFSLHKAAVNVFLCVLRRVWHILWWSQSLSTLVAQVVLGLGLCAPWKGKRSHLFELSQAADFQPHFGNKRKALKCGLSPFPPFFLCTINHLCPANSFKWSLLLSLLFFSSGIPLENNTKAFPKS